MRLSHASEDVSRMLFQSTHPLRGATCSPRVSRRSPNYFNPRTPCGVRRCRFPRIRKRCRFQSTHPLRGATSLRMSRAPCLTISIHAPLAGCDANSVCVILCFSLFQSTHPLRGATRHALGRHALRHDFNPRTPGGVRVWDNGAQITAVQFQSTHPLRGATLI